MEYRGVVEAIADATGAAFSLIPQDNATGNFVKVEQRVPVRIRLTPSKDNARLRTGFNVECLVKYCFFFQFFSKLLLLSKLLLFSILLLFSKLAA